MIVVYDCDQFCYAFISGIRQIGHIIVYEIHDANITYKFKPGYYKRKGPITVVVDNIPEKAILVEFERELTDEEKQVRGFSEADTQPIKTAPSPDNWTNQYVKLASNWDTLPEKSQ